MIRMPEPLQDEFEDYMDARARAVDGNWFDAKIAGVTHRNSDGKSRQDIARTLNPFDELSLRPEPENPFDKNAVAVYTPAGECVGYLEARLAAEYASRSRRGVEYRCFVRTLRIRGELCGVSVGVLASGGNSRNSTKGQVPND